MFGRTARAALVSVAALSLIGLSFVPSADASSLPTGAQAFGVLPPNCTQVDPVSCVPTESLPAPEFEALPGQVTVNADLGPETAPAFRVLPDGYVPGASGVGGTTTDSASGCTSGPGWSWVCIDVYGQSTHVDYIGGEIQYPPYTRSTRFEIFFNGGLVAESNPGTCSSDDDSCVGGWNYNGYVPDRTQICIAFAGYSGQPCETVKK